MDTHEHIVSSYEEELSSLNNKIAKMGGLAEQVLGQSIDALEGRDPVLAAATIQQDEAIDMLEKEIEEQAIVMIARRQPLAYDLRQIMAALRISTELERIGDLGKNIAKRALAVVGEQQPKQLGTGIAGGTKHADFLLCYVWFGHRLSLFAMKLALENYTRQ